MKYVIPMLCLLLLLPIQAEALEIQPPEVPLAAADRMPENTDSFAESLIELIQKAIVHLRPDLAQGWRIIVSVIAAALFLSVANTVSERLRTVIRPAGALMLSTLLLSNAQTMITLASDTIYQLSSYGKLLLPVMTAALAAQGGISSAGALYAGTAVFDMLLSSLIANYLVPLVYLYLALGLGNRVSGEDILKKMQELAKNFVSWGLKTILTVFTTYMSLTGVISGTTDAVKLKAAKMTISSVVPIVGGILSDASETVLISAALMKNSAGLYGIAALLALFLEPFFKIGIQNLMLKAAAALCGIFAPKEISGVVEDFAAAMGLLLGMTASVCVMLLISVVCFMRGVG